MSIEERTQAFDRQISRITDFTRVETVLCARSSLFPTTEARDSRHCVVFVLTLLLLQRNYSGC